MAGGELRLGTVSMYMGAIMHICHVQSSTNMLITWEHFHRGKLARRSNKSETYLRIWADFFWNFGLEDAKRLSRSDRRLRRYVRSCRGLPPILVGPEEMVHRPDTFSYRIRG
jgi:hypothetical protein